MVELPMLRLADAAAWRAWLEENAALSDGVRLVLAKVKVEGLHYSEALEEALCFGWIDSQVRRLDETHHLQNFTPRKARSPWSQRNRELVAGLEASGRMAEAGRAEVERAKADGRWDAAYRQADAPVPDDLAAALAASPAATAMFAALSSQNRFAILFRIGSVKRADTRARKIAEYVAMLERGETLHPQARREE